MHSILLTAAFASGALAQKQLGWNHAPVEKDNDAVSRNYPEVDVELLSPAFLNPETVPEGFANGTAGPTDDATLDYFIRTLANRNDWLNYHAADFLSEEGRSFPYVFLTEDSQGFVAANASSKLRVYLQGGIHGNEPAGDQGILALLGKLDANQTYTASLLEKLDILILPRYNPDGAAYFQREFATNIDPNREGIKLERQQSRDIKKLVNSWHPHVVVDMHEYTASRIYGGVYRHGQDALVASGRNLNTHKDIRNLTEELFSANIGARLDADGFRWEPYVTGPTNETLGSPIVFEEAVTSANSGRNAYGLTQAVAILCELRGIRLADQNFHRRVATALAMLESILETARDNAEYVLETIERSIADFIQNDEDIVLTDYQESTRRSFTMVDTRNGSIVHVPVEFLSSSPATANLTRERPEAYLIPRNRADLAEKLVVQGLDVEILPFEYRGTVQSLNVTSARLGSAWYEGRVRNLITTEPIEKEVRLRAGSFRVSTRQKNAALAFISLEPEVPESFAALGLLHVATGDEYPIFRVLAGDSK
ncbi:carboxypeptidase [Plectosphaerella cucumerina]|uniref:Carboxypeptidase n=1 Tax=Plectosphaerella cucumerina TaxID=40658 RepID=A0A8K0TMU6_9PEZI|nr:carboxypeptidase [Plectosphaerella cucumerina]